MQLAKRVLTMHCSKDAQKQDIVSEKLDKLYKVQSTLHFFVQKVYWSTPTLFFSFLLFFKCRRTGKKSHK